jgi:hypothetical protein
MKDSPGSDRDGSGTPKIFVPWELGLESDPLHHLSRPADASDRRNNSQCVNSSPLASIRGQTGYQSRNHCGFVEIQLCHPERLVRPE